MIARLLKTARSLQFFRKLDRFPLTACSGKKLPFRLIVQECFNWSKAYTWRVTWEMIELVMAEKRTEDLDARKMEAFQSNTKNAKSIKYDNKKQQIRTQLLAARCKDSPMGQGSTQQSVIRRGSANLPTPPPYPFTYHFWQKRYPFRIPSIDKWHPL